MSAAFVKQCKAVKQFFINNPNGTVTIPGTFPPKTYSKEQWKSWLLGCLMDKINRNEVCRGKLDDDDRFWEMKRFASDLNRRIFLRPTDVPYFLRKHQYRFEHRITQPWEK